MVHGDAAAAAELIPSHLRPVPVHESRHSVVSDDLRELSRTLAIDTNRKSHTHFPLAPRSVTLDALERPKRPLAEIKSSYGAHHKNFNEYRLIGCKM